MTAWLTWQVEWVIWPLVVVVCGAMDSLFCGLETGIYVLDKSRLDLAADEGLPAAKFLQRMLARPENLLAVLLIGTNLSRYAVTFAIGAMFVLAGAEARAEWYTLLAATPLLFVLGDSVPKTTFHRLGASVVYRLTWLLRAADILFGVTGLSPLVRGISSLLTRLARTGQSTGRKPASAAATAILAEAHARGVLTHFQSVMADHVMHIAEVTVADAMVPMDRVVTVPPAAGRDELIEIVRPHSYSRLPVLGQDGRVAGIMDAYDILTAPAAGADRTDGGPGQAEAAKMLAPLVLPAELAIPRGVPDALERHAMAVIERDGRHVGIVTMKDLVEEIVGGLDAW